MTSTDTPPFKIFDVKLSGEEVIEGKRAIDEIISVLRPGWPVDKINAKHLSGGILNTLVCFHLVDDKRMNDGLVLRVLREWPADMPNNFDRDIEFFTMQLAAHAGVATEVLALFNNGWVYKLAPGRTIAGADLHDPTIIRGIARALAQLHSVDLDRPVFDRQGRPASYPKDNTFFKVMIDGFSKVPDKMLDPQEDARYKSECRQMSSWLVEYKKMESLLSELKIPTCLCHVDLHIHNLIYNDQDGSVRLIDYELACIAPAAFDFHGCFMDYDVRQMIPTFRDETEPPFTEEVIELWLTEYAKRLRELRGQDPEDVSPYDIRKLRLECQFIDLLNTQHLALIIPTLMAMQGTGDWPVFDILASLEKTADQLRLKLPQLKEEYTRHVAAGKDDS